MTPKPLYLWLMDAFHGRWSTDANLATDSSGRASVRCFFGEHEIEAVSASGHSLRARFVVSRRGPRELTLALAPG